MQKIEDKLNEVLCVDEGTINAVELLFVGMAAGRDFASAYSAPSLSRLSEGCFKIGDRYFELVEPILSFPLLFLRFNFRRIEESDYNSLNHQIRQLKRKSTMN